MLAWRPWVAAAAVWLVCFVVGVLLMAGPCDGSDGACGPDRFALVAGLALIPAAATGVTAIIVHHIRRGPD